MNRFDKFKENLTYEAFAKMLVKLCVINNSELFYVTTSGQLYPFTPEGYSLAINHETNYWSQQLCTDNSNADSNADATDENK